MIKKKLKNLTLKKGLISGLAQNGIFSDFWILCFLSKTLQKPFQYKMFGVFPKIQEIYSKMGTRILKIYWEMSEIMKLKVGNPKNSVGKNWAISSQPRNLTFLEDEIFQLFSHSYSQNEIAPIFYYGKSPKTNEKDLKITNLQPPDWGQPYWMTRYMSP